MTTEIQPLQPVSVHLTKDEAAYLKDLLRDERSHAEDYAGRLRMAIDRSLKLAWDQEKQNDQRILLTLQDKIRIINSLIYKLKL